MEKFSQYCQKCRAANEPGEATCRQCGTRLMLVVIPPSVRHEESLAPSFYEDHLLERVSLLELRMAQLAERLSTALELMLRQAKTTQTDHFLLETLIESLNTLGFPEKDALARQMRSRVEGENLSEKQESRRGRFSNSNSSSSNSRARAEQVIQKILLSHTGPNAELFARLVAEGSRHLSGGEEKQGLRTLERAAQISPRNAALMIFLSESLFRADKFAEAEKYLVEILETTPREPKAELLLSVIYADRGESAKARRLLTNLSTRPENAFCVNYCRGFLAALEENWDESLAAFQNLLRETDWPETRYLTACAYFQTGEFDLAAEHLQTAVERDEKFADAWFMLGVTARRQGENARSETAFERARRAQEAGAQCLEFLQRKSPAELPRALPFARLAPRQQPPPKNILTGGARRLSKIFREEVYKLL